MPPQVAAQSQARDSLELASLASSSLANDGPVSEESSRPSVPSSRRLSLIEEDPLDESNPAGRPATHNRSYSVSSAFDFAGTLFPLSSTTEGGGYAPIGAPISAARPSGGLGGGTLEKHKTLTYLNGLSLIVGLIIGAGIFSSPSQVSSKVGSPGAALVVWVIAGILAWTGAASYAELGGAIPLNGGSQVYLAKTFGEMAGFLFTWVAVLVLKPGGAAIVSIIMGEYLGRAILGAEVDKVSPWVSKSVALVGIFFVTLFNCISTRFGTRLNDLLMILKFVALLAVTVTGITVAITGYTFEGNKDVVWTAHDWFNGTSSDLSNWAVALYAGLWAFDGWDNTNYVVGEFRNPSRDLPRVIHTAMPLTSSRNIGRVGALLIALTVSASCFGALNSSAFTAGRLVYVAGKEGYVPGVFGRIGTGSEYHGLSRQRPRGWFLRRMHACFGDGDVGLFYTPIYALVLNGVLTAGYCIVGEFTTLLTFYGVAGYTFYFITVLGLIVLRVKEPKLERPYKTWITTPIVFCCVSLFLLSKAVFAQPLQTLTVVAFVSVGIPVYFWRIRGRDQVTTKREVGTGERRWWRFWR
ncbi:amino acid permease [Ophiocordyceps sinensis CO18]|uniref:Amino acid permease n=1 Tax=Ophiocordyceps sinensis (strain Co18 / CGMCC 3.14243) TaxID=911162 RepID=T5AN70_OPHSC|nr:amino acid permease [Ophiocordyceps sinensis CO18]